MKRILYENGIAIVMLGIFLFSFAGQIWTGHIQYNDEQKDHGAAQVGLGEYLQTGHFVEATFENWESEFLQMALFVIFTACLRQKGSAASKKLDTQEDVDRVEVRRDSPWPVKHGGVALALYENSLGIALLLLFAVSFVLHAAGGAAEFNRDQAFHGATKRVTAFEYAGTSRFWFESFQNWQSEFLSIGALAVLSIYLRQKGSPESKPVGTPNDEEA